MQPVPTRGDKSSKIWFVGFQPSEKDAAIGTVFGDSVGYHIDKMAREAHLPANAFFCTLQPFHNQLIPTEFSLELFQILTATHKPAIIVTCDSRFEKKLSKTGEEKENEKIWVSDVLRLLCPDTNGILNKYAGSILTSRFLDYPHYIIPTYSPYFIWKNYEQRAVTVFLDYGHVREELDYFTKHSRLNPLPSYELITQPAYPILMDYLNEILNECKLVSVDIETIRPPKKAREKNPKPPYTGLFKNHPGYPYTLGLAKSPSSGISFSLWDYNNEELVNIWKKVAKILSHIPQVGQNYFIFDANMLQALGFDPCIDLCKDTLIRHHVLHPELPHKLQFQTRQYTRQPYYKDEGKNWTVKHKKSLMIYNALDVVTTYKIYDEQELEFSERPHLK